MDKNWYGVNPVFKGFFKCNFGKFNRNPGSLSVYRPGPAACPSVKMAPHRRAQLFLPCKLMLLVSKMPN